METAETQKLMVLSSHRCLARWEPNFLERWRVEAVRRLSREQLASRSLWCNVHRPKETETDWERTEEEMNHIQGVV